MQIEKIKSKDGEVTIEWTTPNENDREAHALKSEDEPEPAFVDALEALGPVALAYLQIEDPADDDDVTSELTTVSVRRDVHGNRAFLFSLRRSVPSGTYSVTTPRLRAPTEDSDPDSPVVLSEEEMELIRDLEHQAIRFVQGHRTQGDLFEPGAEGEEEESVDPFPVSEGNAAEPQLAGV